MLYAFLDEAFRKKHDPIVYIEAEMKPIMNQVLIIFKIEQCHFRQH